MSFALSLAADVVEVEAGAKSPLSFTVVNQGTATDRFEVEIQGIDGEWVAIPVPAFNVEPGETLTEKAFLQPPRRPDGGAGAYPLVVRIRSLESGETKTAQALLKLLPYHHLTMEIAPKKGVISPTTKRNDFRLTVVNLGNSEHTLQLSAQDPDDRCAYEFESDQIVLGPGQQRDVEMIANPKQTPLFSSGRLIGFSVVARSVTERNVSATTQAQLEQRSLLSPTTLATLVLAFAIFFGWWIMRPVPPSVRISVTPSHALAGEKIELRIQAEHADHLVVTMGSNQIYSGDVVPELTAELKGEGGDTVSIVAEVTREGRSETHDTKTIKIDQPVVVPEASIDDLKVSAKRVKLGSSFVLSWKVSNATKVAIAPILDDLSPDLEQQQITPNATGVQTYTFIAFNSEGKTAKKTVSVEVYDESDATILSFTADPESVKEVDGGKTTLAWHVTNAETVELTIGNAAPVSVSAVETGREVVIGAKTSFILTATDAKARKTVKKVTVNFEKKDVVIDPPPTGVTTADPIPNTIPPPNR